MSEKSVRGTKRTCQSCGERFYDLNRDPVVCPLCHAAFAVDPRASRGSADIDAEPKPAKVAKAAPKAFELAPVAAAISEELPEIEASDELADIETEEAEIETTEDDTFLEVEEEGESDVTALIDSPIEGEPEES